MKKKILYISLICIVTLACHTSNLGVSRTELKYIAYNNRANDNRPIYTIKDHNEIKTGGNFSRDNETTKFPDNIKYLGVENEIQPTENHNRSKNSITQSSKKIILRNKEKSNSIPNITEKKEGLTSVTDSIVLSTASLSVSSLNIDSLYLSFIQNRKGLKFEKLRLLQYKAKADSLDNTQKIEKEKNQEIKLNTRSRDVIVFLAFSILLVLVSIFLVKKVK